MGYAGRVQGPAQLTINRRSKDDARIRQLVVSIDGQTAATLLYGESMTRPLEPGPHKLRIHNTLVWKTIEFDAGPGEHIRFSAINRAGPGTYTLIGFLGVGPLYVTIEREL